MMYEAPWSFGTTLGAVGSKDLFVPFQKTSLVDTAMNRPPSIELRPQVKGDITVGLIAPSSRERIPFQDLVLETRG